jgi:hypothetical protein
VTMTVIVLRRPLVAPIIPARLVPRRHARRPSVVRLMVAFRGMPSRMLVREVPRGIARQIVASRIVLTIDVILLVGRRWGRCVAFAPGRRHSRIEPRPLTRLGRPARFVGKSRMQGRCGESLLVVTPRVGMDGVRRCSKGLEVGGIRRPLVARGMSGGSVTTERRQRLPLRRMAIRRIMPGFCGGMPLGRLAVTRTALAMDRSLANMPCMMGQIAPLT